MNNVSISILNNIRDELRNAPTRARNAYFKINVGGHNFKTIHFNRKSEFDDWVYMY
jgi:hypothetical protein